MMQRVRWSICTRLMRMVSQLSFIATWCAAGQPYAAIHRTPLLSGASVVIEQKPSNILLDEHLNAFLSDVGLAKVAEASVAATHLSTRGVRGTPGYMGVFPATRRFQ